MPWGAVAGAAINVVGQQMSKDKNGGAGTTTASKEPWSVATPWLTGIVNQGAELQNQYNTQPFNAQQNQAYANQYAQSDYVRSLIPSLLGQLQSQQLGYDVSNPTAKPKAFTWDAAGGLLGSMGGGSSGSMTQAMQAQSAADAAARAAAPAKSGWTGDFVNQNGILFGNDPVGSNAGGFGSWRYGQMYGDGYTPEAGSQAARDMAEYFNFGGADPNNMYGKGRYGKNSILGAMTLGSGNNSDGL